MIEKEGIRKRKNTERRDRERRGIEVSRRSLSVVHLPVNQHLAAKFFVTSTHPPTPYQHSTRTLSSHHYEAFSF